MSTRTFCDMLPTRRRPLELGFPVQVLGQPGLKAHDTRRWQSNPHLSVGLAYLRDIFVCLCHIDVLMYRMSSSLAPYVTHPGLPQFRDQIDEWSGELAALGQLASRDGLRLSLHPAALVVLSSPRESVVLRSIDDFPAS